MRPARCSFKAPLQGEAHDRESSGHSAEASGPPFKNWLTKRVDGLEQVRYVDRDSCASDRRVTYAVLTDAGLEKLREASKSHVADIRSFFETRFSEEELDQLVELLDRLPFGAEPLDTNCSA